MMSQDEAPTRAAQLVLTGSKEYDDVPVDAQ